MVEATRFDLTGLRGQLRLDEPMSKHTSWRAGGRADRLYVPADLDDLVAFLHMAPADEPLYVVGLGSNLLVRDGGVRGTVVLMHGALTELRLEGRDEEGGILYAEAGVPGAKLARFAAHHDLQGAEFQAGIPGTVGGALAMNSGCFGSETWAIVERVRTIDREGTLRERERGDFEVAYRHVRLKAEAQEWFVAAWFRLEAGEGAASRARIRELLSRRVATQPINLPNAGSVFRNPRSEFAARLIETCGLKGHRLGGAMVSPKHANFIVNVGDASAADIENLIEHCRRLVLVRTGIHMEPEVRIIGEG